MKIYITLTGTMAVDLAGYLWEKLSEREAHARKKRKTYTQDQFAADIGIKPTTLSSIMNAKGESSRIAWETLQVFINYFGKEFTERVQIVPPDDPPAAHWTLEGEGD